MNVSVNQKVLAQYVTSSHASRSESTSVDELATIREVWNWSSSYRYFTTRDLFFFRSMKLPPGSLENRSIFDPIIHETRFC